jgi:hypothetical protein
MGVRNMKKNMMIFAIICILITGVTIGNEIKADNVSNVKSLKVSTLASSSKKKIITISKAELDSERPDKTILKASDKGEDVVRIQIRLRKYGYNVVIDGDYGAQVAYAVMDFQQRRNLVPSGTVSGATLNALYQLPTKFNMYKPATQSLLTTNDVASKATYESALNRVDSTSYTNNYILVNLSKQKVYIFDGTDHNWKLINTFSCGSGAVATPTVTGHFRVGIKGLYFKSGSVYCKYFSQISGNYLFHSILYDKNGNVVDGNLGIVESHGCIRLALKSAKYIYNNIPIGSTIWIK